MKIQRQGLRQPHTLLRNGPHTLRGAALIYALVAVLIISLLILGVGRLVGAHLQYEESSAESSRLIFSAETAANWQLNRMSRVVPNGAVPGLGELSLDDLNNTSKVWMHLPESDTGGVSVQDDVYVYSSITKSSVSWTPPNAFDIFAIARDHNNHNIKRGVRFTGTATGIADRYSIFGLNGVTFDSRMGGNATLARGYVGSNAEINYLGSQAPVSGADPVFGGILLTGGNAHINPGDPSSWSSGWDIARLPDNAYFPTIATIMRNVYPNKSISDLSSPANNSNGWVSQTSPYTPSIQYWDGTIDPNTNQPKGFQKFAATVTQLTSTEFSQSNYSSGGKTYHIIKLQTDKDDPLGNLFVFSQIKMGDNDILVLHREQPPIGASKISTTCRILLNGSAASIVTNIAIFQGTNGTGKGYKPHPIDTTLYHLWYNNLGSSLTFNPRLPPKDTILPPTGYGDAVYLLAPGLPGLAYGIRDNTPGGVRVPGVGGSGGAPNAGIGGSVFVDGTNIQKNSDGTTPTVTAAAAIATQVTLRGAISVSTVTVKDNATGTAYTRQPEFELLGDPFSSILFYRVSTNYYEYDLNNPQFDPLHPFIDYGETQ